MAEKRSLIEGKPWKNLLLFSLPVLVGLLLQQLYNTADTMVIGLFDDDGALAAVGATACLTMVFTALSSGFAAGAGILVARAFGADDEETLKKTAGCAIALFALMGAASTVLGAATCYPVLKYMLRIPDELCNLSMTYFGIYCGAIFFQFMYNIIDSTLRSVGNSKATMLFLLISAVLNIGLDFLFVAAFHWGVAGVAISTVIAYVGSVIAAFVYMYKKYPVFRFKRADLKLDSALCKSILKTGLPMMLQQLIVSVGFIFIQLGVNGYGKLMMASFAVGLKVESYLLLTAVAFQMSMATFAAQNFSANKPERVKTATWQITLLSISFTAVISILAYFLADYIVLMFGVEEASVYCVQHIRVNAIAALLLSSYYSLLGLYQGAGKATMATIFSVSALAMRVLTMYTFRYIPFFSESIVWYNALFGYSVGFLCCWIYFFTGKWKGNKNPAGTEDAAGTEDNVAIDSPVAEAEADTAAEMPVEPEIRPEMQITIEE